MTSHLKVKINSPHLGFEKGAEIDIPCDENGIAINHFWRKRVRDSEIDNCLTIINSPDSKSTSKSTKK